MGQKALKEVVWSKRAIKQLQDIYNYIAEDSFQNAIKVRNGIADKTVKASLYPESFPIDKYKNFNKGNYRAFIKYSYKVSYFIGKDYIRVVRIRHTKMKPLMY
jgi:plasmid stabilization system protein ParE